MKKINPNIESVFVLSSIYSLLLYLLIQDDDKSIKNTLFIISRNHFSEDTLEKLPNYIVMDIFVNKFYQKHPNLIGRVMSLIERYYRLAILKLFVLRNKNKLNHLKLYMHDESLVTSHIINNRSFYTIEDGFINYLSSERKMKNQNKQKLNISIFSFAPKPINYKHSITSYLTKNDNHPSTTYINISSAWQSISEKKQQLILDLFQLTQSDLEKISNKDIIIFTQPFSEIGILKSETSKIAMYREFIDKNDADKVLIKTHPREKTAYHKHFPNVTVFDKKIPAEVFTLLGITFKKAYTVHSTAILNLPEDTQKIIIENDQILGTEKLKQLIN